MSKHISKDTIDLLIEDAKCGLLTRDRIERPDFTSLYDLEGWSPFCDSVWKYDYMSRMFKGDSDILTFMCPEDGRVTSMNVTQTTTIWNINDQHK
jgi:hypothetical protein